MKKLFFLVISVCILFLFACEKETNNDENNADGIAVHEDSSDYIWDNITIVKIELNDNSITVNSSTVNVSNNIATITTAGVYSIVGSLSDGQIIVNTEDEEKVVLILNGANVTCNTSAPIYIQKAKKVVVYLVAGSQNSLIDATSYITSDEPNATLYSKSDLTIFGEGSLIVKGNYNDGITSKDGLIIKSGNITVTSVDDGIRGKDYLIIDNGNISLTTGGDGLKSDNEDNTSLGYIDIKTGKFNVVSGGDAISAQTDISITTGEFNLTSGGGSSRTVTETLSAKGIKGLASVSIDNGTFTINAADDGIHSNKDVTINKGFFSISSSDDGIHADSKVIINDGDVKIAKSFEGIESGLITVNSGSVSITASDDGFNATYGNGGEANDGSCLTINAGNIFVDALKGDGLDSNGSIVITGGTLVVHGPQSQPEVGMDYNGTCNISGGFLVISGTSSNMTQAPSNSSAQCCLRIMMTSNVVANTLFHIQDASGNDIITFKPVRTYSSIIFSSPNLSNGTTYYVYTGGTSTGTVINGLYTDGNYTGGTQYTSFTISSIITSIGTVQGPGGGGGRP